MEEIFKKDSIDCSTDHTKVEYMSNLVLRYYGTNLTVMVTHKTITETNIDLLEKSVIGSNIHIEVNTF